LNDLAGSGIKGDKHDLIDLRNSMITRRNLILTSLLVATEAPLARAEPAATDDPVAILNAIYARVAKGKGDGGGGFVIENKAAKAKYLSKSLIALWAKADAHTPKGDVGPVDFDPVTIRRSRTSNRSRSTPRSSTPARP
jgi:hypothetical protein